MKNNANEARPIEWKKFRYAITVAIAASHGRIEFSSESFFDTLWKNKGFKFIQDGSIYVPEMNAFESAFNEQYEDWEECWSAGARCIALYDALGVDYHSPGSMPPDIPDAWLQAASSCPLPIPKTTNPKFHRPSILRLVAQSQGEK